ncbi:8-oxo-dGTP pyrophosphatase MutT, NUDIX family [Catalinimonas alkaloidigena]|uniref:GDP-mannose pyrophosphatase n=1 Tax=Catalinimonas alkaloidigena TaxID=1075417 RepID=A0A1G9KB59_9BACT|nr:NUDIX hydrolase [Catalinimonas alkaloidigena]SDL46664.1 8-oxo-dGTP pyrophosphatase MutT, NUDIX family [Catalinimonas alkaloidigena]
MEEKKNNWQTLSSRPIYDNPWVNVREYQVINPRGGEGIYGVVSFKNKALAIVPIDEEQHTWLVGQWRYPLNEYSWEIPMGGGPLSEDILTAAKRELQEETGLTAKKWTELLRIHTSNSVTDEEGFVFIAEDLTPGETLFDETEDLEIRRLPLREAVAMAMDGRITDSISLAALLKIGMMYKL